MADFWIKVGDTAPAITATLKDGDGNPADLQAADVVFRLRSIRGTEPVIDAPAENLQSGDGSDGSKGKVQYEWQAGDTDVAGGFYAEWPVTFSGGEIETFRNDGYNRIAIVESLEGTGS